MTGAHAPIAPRPWMTDPATTAVMDAVTAGGGEARFIGGCVRDTVAGRPVKDVDIATPLAPAEVVRRLEAAGLKAVPTGIGHGTVTAVAGGRGFEVTTLRRDISTDGRRAVVAFTDDWAQDAARRDLTFNALSMTRDGAIHDPFGGLEDLAAGRVRFIGDPAVRLAEDRLRLLRFFRFLAWYGRVPPDGAALAACRAAAPDLRILSAERVRGELLRLLEAPDPLPAWQGLAAVGALPVVLPEADDGTRLARMVGQDRAAGLPPDPLLRLAAAVRHRGGGAEALAARLRLSNAARDRLLAVLKQSATVAATDEGRWAGLRFVFGTDGFRDAARLSAAFDGDGARLARAMALAAQPERTFPLRGEDLVARGVPPGPEVGRRLAELRSWWMAGGLSADRAACLAALEARLGQPGGGSD